MDMIASIHFPTATRSVAKPVAIIMYIIAILAILNRHLMIIP